MMSAQASDLRLLARFRIIGVDTAYISDFSLQRKKRYVYLQHCAVHKQNEEAESTLLNKL